MTVLKLKTDIACGGCVGAVKLALDADPRIASWSVDTASPDKVLTVEGDGVARDRVAAILAGRGFHVLGEVAPAARRCCCG